MPTYRKKIEETIRYGGDQLLLQGGHHPELGLQFYVDTFRQIKAEFPDIRLHALGPPEVAHITKLEKSNHKEVLQALKAAGLDSLPGAGAEILVDRVRRLISKGKCGAQEWLDIMHEAHKLDITTSATMMFGHVETIEERFEHLVKIREVQHRKPERANGFLAFIAWTFQDVDTLLTKIRGVHNLTTTEEYIKMVALSRIMLPNIKNIQASWLTVGKPTAQLCLHAGANDFGSIMIEENVVSAAGAPTGSRINPSRKPYVKRVLSPNCARSNMNGGPYRKPLRNRWSTINRLMFFVYGLMFFLHPTSNVKHQTSNETIWIKVQKR